MWKHGYIWRTEAKKRGDYRKEITGGKKKLMDNAFEEMYQKKLKKPYRPKGEFMNKIISDLYIEN